MRQQQGIKRAILFLINSLLENQSFQLIVTGDMNAKFDHVLDKKNQSTDRHLERTEYNGQRIYFSEKLAPI